MVDCASAWSTRAAATAMSRLPVCASPTSEVSCGSPKPCHQDGSGQIFAWSGAAVAKDLGCICGARACGIGVEQPASIAAIREDVKRRSGLFIAQCSNGVGAGNAQGMNEDGRPGDRQSDDAGTNEIG